MAYVDFVFLEDGKLLSSYAEKFGQRFASPSGGDYSFRVFGVGGKSGDAGFAVVRGGTLEANTFAVSNPGVDVLLSPVGEGRPFFDSALASLASQNKTAVAVDFSRLLNSGKRERGFLLRNYLHAAKLCRKKGAFFCVFSCAKAESELRQVKDFSSVLCMLGYERGEALKVVRGTEAFLLSRKKISGYGVVE